MQIARKRFEIQRATILGNLETKPIDRSYTKRNWLDDLIDWAVEEKAFAEALKPAIFTSLVESGKDALLEVDQVPSLFDPFAPAIQEYFKERSDKIAVDVDAETSKQIRATLSEGISQGRAPTRFEFGLRTSWASRSHSGPT